MKRYIVQTLDEEDMIVRAKNFAHLITKLVDELYIKDLKLIKLIIEL